MSRSDVAVIAPCSLQVSRLRHALAGRGLGGVLAGSAETLQGQERRVGIVSTVRSATGAVSLATSSFCGAPTMRDPYL